MTFQDFKFKENLQKAIDEAGFKEPSPIQIDAIPHILLGKDIVGQAHTGTGKTAAFGLPVLNQLTGKNAEAVVIVPTRELAMQVSDELFKFGKFLGINTATVYGGQSYSRQLKLIETASVIVATPGRFLDLLKNEHIKIKPKFVILDEADEMLDMGFLDDIKDIFTYLPEDRQTLLFSATMPTAIKNLAKTILKEPEFVTITKSDVTNKNITQTFYVVDEKERDDALIRLFDYKNPKKSIIFCRTKKDVDRLSTFLLSQGFMAKSLHGDMEQKQREEAIKAFKTSRLEILIATDVAARGLDVNDVTHVFNYHLPFDGESYVHRIGRTGRAGKDGMAISIVTPHEFRTLQRIEKTIGAKLESKVVPNISTVKQKKIDELKQSILDQEIKDYAITIVEELKEEFDISTIAFKLASIIASKTYVKGNNHIGKSESDISRLIENMLRNSDRGDDRRGSSRGRGRSGSGQRRDSGSRDDRGGQRRPSTSRSRSSSSNSNKDSSDKPARSSRPRRRD